MLSIPFAEIVRKICNDTKVSEKMILDKIKAKKKELNGLVSDEGAAYIIASEMGVDVVGDLSKKKLKIKDVLIGMRSVAITGRVLQVFDVREFSKKDGTSGKVGAFQIGDDTGKVRVVVWNDQVELLKNLEQGMAVKITGAYSRENKYTGIELHLGARSKLEEVEGEDLPELEKVSEQPTGETFRGIVVQAYRPNFYEVCGECGKSVKNGPCPDHPDNVKKAMLLSFMLDDGKSYIRCVAFRDEAEKLASLSVNEAQKIIVDKNEAALADHVENKLLGEVIDVTGRIRHNANFDRDEIMASSVSFIKAADVVKNR